MAIWEESSFSELSEIEQSPVLKSGEYIT